VAEITGIVPILFVRDVERAAYYYRDRLGFEVEFLYGTPPFYGAVRRGRARLHLRFVEHPNFAELASREESLILASIEVSNVKTLFAEFQARSIEFPQTLERQIWGGTDFHVRDPDGNVISFVQYGESAGA
jgi:uncharacterized glyoxalase superfamily protein PhnB